jgi:hypothetical protein
MAERAVYLIRRKSDGFVMPDPASDPMPPSWHEPSSWRAVPPRLFKSKKAAQSALSQWLRGRQSKGPITQDQINANSSNSTSSFLSLDQPSQIYVEVVRTRKKRDMEVVMAKVIWDD